jgi:hypothetical protein
MRVRRKAGERRLAGLDCLRFVAEAADHRFEQTALDGVVVHNKD